jgi:hypothetical protein
MLHKKTNSLSRAAIAAIVPLLLCSLVDGAHAEDDATACIAASEDGQKLRDDGHYLRARASFISCAHEACPAQIRSDCLQWLDDVDKKTPTVVLSARDSGKDVTDVSVSVDGIPFVDRLDGRPLSLDPGEHRFRWTHASEPPLEEAIVLRAAEKNRRISAKFGTDPLPVRPGPPALAFVLGGVAVVGVGVFAFSGITGLNEINSCNKNPSCNVDNSKSKPLTYFIIGDSSLAVGLTAGVVATYLFLKHRDAVMPDQRVTAGVSPTPHGASAGLSIRF